MVCPPLLLRGEEGRLNDAGSVLDPAQELALFNGNAHVHVGPAFPVVKVLSRAAGHASERECEERQIDRAFYRDFFIGKERPGYAHQDAGQRRVHIDRMDLVRNARRSHAARQPVIEVEEDVVDPVLFHVGGNDPFARIVVDRLLVEHRMAEARHFRVVEPGFLCQDFLFLEFSALFAQRITRTATYPAKPNYYDINIPALSGLKVLPATGRD